MVNTNYQYYRFENKHVKDVQTIFWKAFGFKISETVLKNKYDTSYLGVKNPSTIAYDKQKPIAFYGAIPQGFKNNTETFLVAHTCDSYTLKNYQKQGLHYTLALKSYEIMQQQNFKMAYAFHSENTYYSTKKLKWKEHRKMCRFHMKINRFPTARIYNKIGFNSILLKKAQEAFASYIINDSDNPFSKTRLTHQEYGNHFYTYKNGLSNHLLVKIEDCVFYLKLNSIVNVGFFDFENENDLLSAIVKLKKIVSKIGLNEILFQVDSCSQQFKILTTFLTPQSSWLVGYVPFEESLTLENYAFNFADLDTF